jgi:hypothetical protein
MDENQISKIIVDCCYRIHTTLSGILFFFARFAALRETDLSRYERFDITRS